MSLIAALCTALFAALAVVLWVPAGPARAWRRLQVSAPASLRVWPWVLAALVMIGSMIAGLAVFEGPAVAAAATSIGAVTATVLLLLRRHRWEARCERRRVEVAQACAALAAQLRIGRVPTEALIVTSRDRPVFELVARQVQLGADVVDCLLAAARAPGSEGLRGLAEAWIFAQRTGAPLAGVVDRISAALREDQATRRTVMAELAAPRASGVVMAVLPLLGIGLGYLIGGDPLGFLVGGPIGWTCLLCGTLLALAGVFWLDRLARVSEPGAEQR